MSSDPKIPKKILRRERALRGWTLQSVADRLYKLCEKEGRDSNISADVVGRWERGTSTPQLHYQAKLCTLYGKATTAELGFTEPPAETESPPAPSSTSSTVPHARRRSEEASRHVEDEQNDAHVHQGTPLPSGTVEDSSTTRHELQNTPLEEDRLLERGTSHTREEDWGGAPHIVRLYGRDRDLFAVE